MNRLLDTDSYKVTHWGQYPEDTTKLVAYFEARSGAKHEDIVWFGLSPIISLLMGPVDLKLDYAEGLLNQHGVPFNREGWQYIQDTYDGALPIKIWALPEGTVASPGDPLMIVESTDERVPWVTTWVETQLARAWYPSTVASSSRSMRKLLHKAWEVSSDSPIESLDFKLHDFGSRGASSAESAQLGGMAHLINFKGTDSVTALYGVDQHYWRDLDEPAGMSIPASEHSTVTSWGRYGEEDFLRNLIHTFGGPGKMVAFVCDSYDMTEAIDMVIRNEDFIRVSGTTLVVRPDSGDPIKTPLAVLNRLAGGLGVTHNDKGYALLPDYIRVLQGDGMVPETLEALVKSVLFNRFSIDNIAFGMGAGLTQKVDRDTERFAYKVCGIQRASQSTHRYQNVVKNPATDPTKRSKGWSEVEPARDKMLLVYDVGVTPYRFDWDAIVERGQYRG